MEEHNHDHSKLVVATESDVCLVPPRVTLMAEEHEFLV